MIGVLSGRLYRFMFQATRALVAQTINSELCKIWHRRMTHLHHGLFKMLREMVIGLLEFNVEHQDVCRGCALGNNSLVNNCNYFKRLREGHRLHCLRELLF